MNAADIITLRPHQIDATIAAVVETSSSERKKDADALEEMVEHYEKTGRVSDRKAYHRIIKYPEKYGTLHQRLRAEQERRGARRK